MEENTKEMNVATPSSDDNSIYSRITTSSDRALANKEEAPGEDKPYDGLGLFAEKFKNNCKSIVVGVLYFGLALFAAYAFYVSGYNFVHSNFSFTIMPLWCFIPLVFVPLLLWFYSTGVQFYSYYNRKRRLFLASLFSSLFTVSTLYLSVLSRFVFAMLSFVPIKNSVTMNEQTVVISGWIIIAVLYTVPMFRFGVYLIKSSHEDLFVDWFNSINFSSIFPERRKNARYKYDLAYIINVATGKIIKIFEEWRTLHTEAIGATGSGKTSTLGTVAFESDLSVKAHNIDYQKKQIHKMCEDGLAELTKPFDDIDFSIEYVSPKKGLPDNQRKKIEAAIKELKYKAKDAGMTIFCPNTEYCDELYSLCEAKGLRAYRIDPVKDSNREWKKGFIGFNPLYVRHDAEEDTLSYFDRVFDVAKGAADVNQAVFDLQGVSDPYFSGLNRNIYVAATIACVIGMPLVHPGRYAKPNDVQYVLNDFERIKIYRDAIVTEYGIPGETGNVELRLGKARVVEDLQFIIDRIDSDMLGANAKIMMGQAVGLRNIVDDTLSIPTVRQVLCSDETLDFNKALAEGQVTLVNFNMQMGEVAATNFGLFILLNFINAVLRRPGDLSTRIPHFLMIDECARLFHPRLEIALSLFRQYNIACTYFFQNLDQFNKNETTKYLKGVFASNCAHQIIFGRAGIEEMKYIEEICGQRKVRVESTSVRESALIDDSTNKNFTTQYKDEFQNNVEASDARYRNFLECTVLTVRYGTPLPPFVGKTNFLPKYKRKPIKRLRYYDWRNFYTAPVENEGVLTFETTSVTSVNKGESSEVEHPRVTLPSSQSSSTTISGTTKSVLVFGGYEDGPEVSRDEGAGLRETVPQSSADETPKSDNKPSNDGASSESGAVGFDDI